ncbi:MAG: hypothetical protein PHN75_02400 [Syntrophales bacterium]|nr:hypothetical protein [Syntrophales bacterium]
MDRNFFEFWGQLFLNVSKGQKQLEEMNSLLNQGVEGYESIRTLFRNIYGLDAPLKGFPQNAESWEKAADNFHASLRQMMAFWGVVPKDDYEALLLKHEALEKKAGEQEQTILYLKTILGERQDAVLSSSKEFQDLLTKQQQEFQLLMSSMGYLFEDKKKNPSGKKH